MVTVSDIDEAGPMFREEAMLEDDITYAKALAWNLPDADRVRVAAKIDPWRPE